MCFLKDQFIPGTETIKTVVASNGLLKKITAHTFYVKLSTSTFNLCFFFYLWGYRCQNI